MIGQPYARRLSSCHLCQWLPYSFHLNIAFFNRWLPCLCKYWLSALARLIDLLRIIFPNDHQYSHACIQLGQSAGCVLLSLIRLKLVGRDDLLHVHEAVKDHLAVCLSNIQIKSCTTVISIAGIIMINCIIRRPNSNGADIRANCSVTRHRS